MALKIMPHGRLQEWFAEEKGYFAAEGLDCHSGSHFAAVQALELFHNRVGHTSPCGLNLLASHTAARVKVNNFH